MFAMMPARPMETSYGDNLLEDTQLLQPSVEDFEEQERRSPVFSDFRSDRAESELDDASSAGRPWSPPGFRNRSSNPSGWFRQDPYGAFDLRPSMSPSRSRQTSPEAYQDAPEGDPDITIAVNTPLPAGTDSPVRERSPEVEPQSHDTTKKAGMVQEQPLSTDNPSNCMSTLSVLVI
jgi:hypothetical protein